ncbi:Crp/Fnr family transcriptional regulator [Aquimarina rhabdastrellae]
MPTYFPPLFPDELIKKLISMGHCKSYAPGEIILTGKQKQNLNYFMIDGLVKVYLEKNGKKFFISYQKDSDFRLLNTISAISNRAENFSFKVVHPSEILILSKKQVFESFHDYPSFKKHIFDCYQKEYQMIIDNLKFTLSSSLIDRLYDYLKVKAAFLNDYKVPYTTQEIAEDLQFSRQSITKGLMELEQQQKIIRNINTIIML